MYIDALGSQSSYLETFEIDIQFDEWKESIEHSNFPALQSLTISLGMSIGDNVCFWLNPAPTLDRVKLLPSNLQHLKFRHDCGVFIVQQFDMTQDCSPPAPRDRQTLLMPSSFTSSSWLSVLFLWAEWGLGGHAHPEKEDYGDN